MVIVNLEKGRVMPVAVARKLFSHHYQGNPVELKLPYRLFGSAWLGNPNDKNEEDWKILVQTEDHIRRIARNIDELILQPGDEEIRILKYLNGEKFRVYLPSYFAMRATNVLSDSRRFRNLLNHYGFDYHRITVHTKRGREFRTRYEYIDISFVAL